MNNQKDLFGNILVFVFLALIIVAGIISYKSIDWDVLKRVEESKLVLPTPAPVVTTAPISTPTATIKE